VGYETTKGWYNKEDAFRLQDSMDINGTLMVVIEVPFQYQ